MNTLLTDMSRILFHDEEGDSSNEEEDDCPLQTYIRGKEEAPKTAKIVSLHTVNGLTFSTYTHHKGNSFILIHQSSLQSIPAHIKTMIQISKNEILFVVQYFLWSESSDVIYQTILLIIISIIPVAVLIHHLTLAGILILLS